MEANANYFHNPFVYRLIIRTDFLFVCTQILFNYVIKSIFQSEKIDMEAIG